MRSFTRPSGSSQSNHPSSRGAPNEQFDIFHSKIIYHFISRFFDRCSLYEWQSSLMSIDCNSHVLLSILSTKNACIDTHCTCHAVIQVASSMVFKIHVHRALSSMTMSRVPFVKNECVAVTSVVRYMDGSLRYIEVDR